MGQRYTILLVEDNSGDVLLIRRALRGIGVQKKLIVIADGGLAVQYLSGAGEYADRRRYSMPHLVLLDLKLRGISGFEVLQWIRLDASLKSLPVVVLTASTYSADVRRAYELGANSFMSKHNDLSEFSAAVRDIVKTWLVVYRASLSAAVGRQPRSVGVKLKPKVPGSEGTEPEPAAGD